MSRMDRVSRLHGFGAATPKTAGSDRHREREADRAADRVLRMRVPTPADTADGGVGHAPRWSWPGRRTMPAPEPGRLIAEEGTRAGMPQIVGEAIASPGRGLDPATRTFMEPRFGHDFSRVRIHADAMAGESARAVHALAFTVGSHVVVAPGARGRGSDPSRWLLAHELAHVVQQDLAGQARLQRYEGPEHQDLGDRYAQELLAFLQTPDGGRWAQERGLNRDALVAQMQSDPLLHGGRIRLPARSQAAAGSGEGRELTPGEIISLMGDLYGTVDELANAPAGQLRDLLAVMQGERAGTVTDAAQRYEHITGGQYLALAQRNETHFAPRNRAEWRRLHEAAIAEAQGAGRERSEPRFDGALLTDAAAGHFLTDAFAAGHMFDRSQVVAQITLHLRTHPLHARNPQMQGFVGVIDLSGKLPQLVLKNLHDRMNREGFEVRNARGMRWRTFGDDYLALARETQRIAALAVFESRQQIHAARGGASPNPDEVEALMPDEETVQRATQQAIGLIPQAMADVEGLIYQNRSLAPTQFGRVLGTIVESNLTTIGQPGRELEINEMLDRAQRIGFEAPVAPSFTLASWR
jgi:hypothetical protein